MRARQYKYTLKDIANCAGVTYDSVKKAAWLGRLNPDNLMEVASYIAIAQLRKR